MTGVKILADHLLAVVLKTLDFVKSCFLSLNIAFVFPPSRQQYYIIGVKYFENLLFDVNVKMII